MQINGATANNSLYKLALRWAQASSTDYPFDPDFVQDANTALDDITAVIMQNDNSWEFEDGNNSDLPIATTDLVSGQDNYSLPVSHLKIQRVRIKDPNGNWITLDPIQRRELTDSQLAETGTPRGYDKFGNSLFLHPTPNYSSTGGLEEQHQRGANYFASGDTTKEPGFASPFHKVIAWIAALTFCEMNGKDKQAAKLMKKIGEAPLAGSEGSGEMAKIATHYRTRDYDRPQTITLKQSKRSLGLLT